MKLFNRGQNAAAGPASTQAVAPPVEAKKKSKEEKPSGTAHAASAGPSASTPSADAADPAAAPSAPAAPDVAELLESSVKDISDKVARLASSVETTGAEREAFEAKLSVMEDRMRKLSSLTEMISAQYNPFIGDAPPQREAMPTAEAGLSSPPLAPSELAEFEGDAPPATAAASAFDEMEEPPAMDALEPDFDAASPAPPAWSPPAPASMRLEKFGDDFQTSMVLLKWADLLLQNTQSREGVADLVEYYHNIGWLGEQARDQLLAYAEGIAFDEPAAGSGEWRATAEFHEISLLFLDKLKNLHAGAR